MIALLISLSVALPIQEPEQKAPVPDARKVEETVAQLEAAFDKGNEEAKLRAIQASASVPDGVVAKWVARGLKDRSDQIVLASIESLGWMEHPGALKALETHYKRNQKKLKKDELRLPALLKAVGRHGKPSSIPILTEDPFGVKKHDAIQARIYGLGNIRHKDAIEALVDMLKKAGPRAIDDYMGDIRLVLYRLSGEDHGNSVQLWGDWWREVRKQFELPKEAPVLDEDQQKQWNRYWAPAKKAKDDDQDK